MSAWVNNVETLLFMHIYLLKSDESDETKIQREINKTFPEHFALVRMGVTLNLIAHQRYDILNIFKS